MRSALAPLVLLAGCSAPPVATPKPMGLPTLKNTLGITLVRLPGGEFSMGHARSRGPVHRVRVSPFAIAACEVTNRQYERLVPGHRRTKESPGDDDPAVGIPLREAKAFAALLSKREGRLYRLPTDAEWEYAARGGLEGKDFPWGDERTGRRMNTGSLKATKVGSYPPNAFGLYDMAGNAGEWILDTEFEFRPEVADAIVTDPLYLDKEPGGALYRGSTFNFDLPVVWLAFVALDDPDPESFSDVGIRLVLDEDGKAPRPILPPQAGGGSETGPW